MCDDKITKGAVRDVLCRFYMRVLYFLNNLNPRTEFHPHGMIWHVGQKIIYAPKYSWLSRRLLPQNSQSINRFCGHPYCILCEQTKLAKISFTPGRYASHFTGFHETYYC